MADEGRKREFVIDSSDSARPPATLQSEPKYFSDIKPKKRVLVDIIYEETGDVAKTKKGKAVKLILRTAVYDDGVLVQKTVGEENEEYQEFLRTGVSMPDQSETTTAVYGVSDKVQEALNKSKGIKVSTGKGTEPRKTADKE